MLHPDPLQRATLSRVRKHPWAAPVVPAVYKAIAEPKDSSLLISEDPTKDLYEGALRKVGRQTSLCACCVLRRLLLSFLFLSMLSLSLLLSPVLLLMLLFLLLLL
jgi:hypothetical protein